MMPQILARTRKDDYLGLVQAFPLRKLCSDAEHADALKMSRRLIGLDRKLTPGEGRYLDALVVLIREYERANHEPKLRKAKGVEVLRHLMAERGMSQAKLAKLLGIGESTVSMILSGSRELTKSHISVLSNHFEISVTAFFPDTQRAVAHGRKKRQAPVRPGVVTPRAGGAARNSGGGRRRRSAPVRFTIDSTRRSESTPSR